ncbi:uncharacterized protein LOC113202751 [Frankliniella occidentalis]|uniref:Uncharacterized protein LOC113202751 n=1 Tax=Frankliniella occidentalis TaxID=133901 RepID=A0A9C6XAW0_FRAOC|nr:uncharacterized protein LOC113202751 [Frankliniella occidentalis]
MQLALMLLGGALLSVAAVTRVHADDVINTVDMDTYDDDRAKRPFCNAFTGECMRALLQGFVNYLTWLLLM